MSAPEDPFRPPSGGQQPPPAPAQQPYGQPQYGPPPGYGPPQYGPPQTDSKAIIALVLAIVSFVVLPLIPAVVT